MILSRNWLNEFVDLKDITDKEFNDEMTLSGSKVETIERPDENLKNVVVGKILEMKRFNTASAMAPPIWGSVPPPNSSIRMRLRSLQLFIMIFMFVRWEE